MPWQTPTLRDVRSLVRDAVNASLPGADANVPNSVLRVLSDNQGALCHLTLQYIDWLALQLLPDTAETEWLDRHGQIWLVNSDGSTGRKMATLSSGTASFVGLIDGTVIPQGSQLQTGTTGGIGSGQLVFETLSDITTSANAPVEGSIRAVDPGSIGNLVTGSTLTLSPPTPASVARQPLCCCRAAPIPRRMTSCACGFCSAFAIRRWAAISRTTSNGHWLSPA